MSRFNYALPMVALSALSAMASPLLFERQRGESPCFGQPGDRCPPATYCDSSLAPRDFDACANLINDVASQAGDLCVSGRACRTWTAEDACRVGICNNDSNGVCNSASQFAAWGTEVVDTCNPAGGTLIPDRPQWFEVYVTTPLPQQTPGEARVQGGVVEKTMSIEEFQAENAQIRAAAESGEVEKRQQDGDDGFDVTVFRFGAPRDGSSEVVSDILDDGSTWAAEQSETFTFGVSASVGLETSFFTTMTASAGITVDTSTSYTNSKTTTLTVNCPDACGIVEYFHFFDCYEGNFTPSGSPGDFCVPIDQGQYRTRCVGCGF